ncbi:MAG: sensor histidine kinase, partial [Dehalococcoidales bacterium]|nr:sensor histidine kinase [Dehalococcoidales bacterium]
VDNLLNELLFAQENERKRVAIEIHDGVAQWMVGASFGIKACSTLISESRLVELEAELNKIRETMKKSVTELRRAIFNLRPIPLQEMGLIPAIGQTTGALREEGVECRIEAEDNLPPLSLAEETTAYWIIQESLSNIRKHASATNVVIRVRFQGQEMRVEIRDDGDGFDTEAVINSTMMLEHMGLIGMQERAKLIGGTVSIESNPGKGTAVSLRFPVLPKQITTSIY